MVFRANVGFPVALIGVPDPDPALTHLEQQKIASIYQFMEDVFTQKAGPDPSQTYRAPEALVKIFFDYPADIARAWMYRSLANRNGPGTNFAFRPAEGHDLLELLQVNICRCVKVLTKLTSQSALTPWKFASRTPIHSVWLLSGVSEATSGRRSRRMMTD